MKLHHKQICYLTSCHTYSGIKENSAKEHNGLAGTEQRDCHTTQRCDTSPPPGKQIRKGIPKPNRKCKGMRGKTCIAYRLTYKPTLNNLKVNCSP